VYVEESGTSIAAAQVSGAMAAILSAHRDLIGKPDAIKQAIVDTAAPLAHPRGAGGAGLLDLKRAFTDAATDSGQAAAAKFQQELDQATVVRIPKDGRKALRLFTSYAHEDSRYHETLERSLLPLQRQGLITYWSDRQISGGQKWEDEIKREIYSADIILLLISMDFLASDYCYGVELRTAISMEERGQARVVPILLRPADVDSSPFAGLQSLPTGKEITRWQNRDEAWLAVARGVRDIVKELNSKRQSSGS
jgi:hypothetical protein